MVVFSVVITVVSVVASCSEIFIQMKLGVPEKNWGWGEVAEIGGDS